MRITKRQAKATSLDHAIELAKRHAKERRLPSKVMADLMGVELKTYYRWLLENTLPLNRIAQFEALTGSRFISEYLSVLHGNRVVIESARTQGQDGGYGAGAEPNGSSFGIVG